MANRNTSEVIQHLCRAVLQDRAGMTDGQLLDCFLSQRDDTAFVALVRRHGPMVWGVCRRVLHHHHDAEDAFQATFLVLVHKAASVEPKEMVANWLYGVAYQTALKARAMAAKRKARERQVVEMPEPAVEEREVWHDLRPLLDQELSRLPDKYRVPIVLCDLEGKTRREVALQLGWPEGTVAGRLATARKMLARRLARHGLALSGGALAAVLSHKAAVAVPASVVSATMRAAMLVAAGQAAAVGLISAKVAALTEGVLKAMFVTKLKVATAVLLMAAGVVGSGGFICRMQAAQQGRPGERPATSVTGAEQDPQAEKKPKEDKDQKSLKAAMNKALADVQRARDELTSAEIQLKALTERYERLKEAYEKEEAKPQGQEETKSLWNLDFRFKDLRLVMVDGRHQGQARKAVWYCWYEVSNPTDEAHTFIPDFELVAADKVYDDTVLPGVQEAVRRIEDPEQALDMKNSVTIANKPILPSKRTADENKSMVGLALWEGVDPDAKSVTLFVSGLSNDWSSDGDTVRRKTLKLRFKRVGNEMRPTGPAEWVYRATKVHEEDDENDQQAEIERRAWTNDWRVVEVDGKGELAYINLGSSDGITPKVTFSIRSMGPDSKPNPAKGALEVVRVIGPHLSQVQVTSVADPKTDPIRKGDQLFNPSRNPDKTSGKMPETAKDREGREAGLVIEGLIKQLEDRNALLEQELLDWKRKRERLHVQIWLTEDEMQRASADKNVGLRAKLKKKKEEQEQLLATCESELTARYFALELQKKRLKALRQLLLRSGDKPPDDRHTVVDRRRSEIEKTRQAIVEAEIRGKVWQEQREHLQAAVNELERQLKTGNTEDLNRRVELELLSKRLKMLETSLTPKDKP
jgi:RNA polymerase sigma factor (sigma-70 family)